MTQTISKHIGEGFGKGELYAALAYDETDAFGGMKIKSLSLAKTLGANELGMELDIEAPLGTVLHNWTAALRIDITQTSTISDTWNVRGRLMAANFDVNINDTVTNVFGVIAKINILNTMATSSNEINDIQALMGVINVNATVGTTLIKGQTQSTICGVKGSIQRSQTGAITVEQKVYAGVFSYNMDGSTVSGKNGIIELYNYGSDTCDTGIYIHPFGTITTGIHLDISDVTGAGAGFTTGISIGDSTNPLPLTSGVYPLYIAGDITGTKTSGSFCSQLVETAVLTGFDITTTAQIFGILSQLNIEGTTTLSAGGVNTAIGAYFVTGSNAVTATNCVCCAMSAIMYAQAGFTVSSGGIYCGLAVLDFTHATSVTANDDNLVGGIYISPQGGNPLPNALLIGTGVKYFVHFPEDGVIATPTGGTGQGWFKVNIGGYGKYVHVYDNV